MARFCIRRLLPAAAVAAALFAVAAVANPETVTVEPTHTGSVVIQAGKTSSAMPAPGSH